MYLFIVIVMIGYLVGCINGSQIIGKFKQINIKQSGMKNAGATNTTLLLGWRYGFIVAFIDVVKATLSLAITAIIISYYNVMFETAVLLLYVNAMSVVIGHKYALKISFRCGNAI